MQLKEGWICNFNKKLNLNTDTPIILGHLLSSSKIIFQ